jgi:hypothetical protein
MRSPVSNSPKAGKQLFPLGVAQVKPGNNGRYFTSLAWVCWLMRITIGWIGAKHVNRSHFVYGLSYTHVSIDFALSACLEFYDGVVLTYHRLPGSVRTRLSHGVAEKPFLFGSSCPGRRRATTDLYVHLARFFK